MAPSTTTADSACRRVGDAAADNVDAGGGTSTHRSCKLPSKLLSLPPLLLPLLLPLVVVLAVVVAVVLARSQQAYAHTSVASRLATYLLPYECHPTHVTTQVVASQKV